jgi:DNA-binding Lrp family transcriptional regulator
MWLTKHEKEVLKLLLDNGKLSDTSLAEKLNISTQAIGRIRKRLEEDVIKKYSVELDTNLLGLKIISLIKFKLNNLNPKQTEEVEKEMIKDKQVINILKLTPGNGEYIITCGCNSLEELDNVMLGKKLDGEKYIHEFKEVYTFPLNHVLKGSFEDLSNKLIDSCGIKHVDVNII